MFRKEITYYFTSPIAYIVIGLYLLAVSLFLWVIPGQYNVVESGYAQLDGFFAISPWLLMLVCPALTMRLFAEERRSGMWDLLMTKACPLWRIILGKYLAALLLIAIALLPCFVHFVLVAWMAEPMGNLDFGQFVGSMVGLLLLSSAYLSVSLFVSSLSKSQIVCFLIAAVVCFCLFWPIDFLIPGASFQSHFETLARGVLSLQDVVYLLSYPVVCVLVTIFRFEH